MTNKLVVIINSLKVPKIKKILLYEMKYLVPNYRCLQNPWLGGYRPQIPVLSVLNWICWTPPPNKIPGYATAVIRTLYIYVRKDVRVRGYFSKLKGVREQNSMGKTVLEYSGPYR